MTDVSNAGAAPSREDEIDLVDIMLAVAKHKRAVIAIAGVATVLAVVVSLLMPNIYTATARLPPPQKNESVANILLGQLGGLSSIAGNSLGIKNPNDLYVGMVRSRTVADSIIRRFNFQSVYEEETMFETRKELEDNTSVVAGKDGLIRIEFDDEDPKRAADVVNAYVEELQSLMQSLAVTEAAQRRLFFEQQLKQAKNDLAHAEVALQLTQEKTGLIKLDDQGKAIIEAIASLRAQIAAKEVELRAIRSFATERNSDYVRAVQQLSGLRSELAKLEQPNITGKGDILLPAGQVPEAGLEYLRKFRDVKYFETIFELLAKQYEIAKIDESQESTLLQVLDHAVVPDKKSKPKRALIVIIFALVGGVLGILVALWRETAERIRNDPNRAPRLAVLRDHLTVRSR